MKDIAGAFKQCPSCHIVKAINDYTMNVAMKDGLAFYCRDCANTMSQASYTMSQASYRRRRAAAGKAVVERKAEVENRGPAPDGSKWCPDCAGYLPIIEFTRNRSTRDGYASYCKPHQNARTYRSRQEVHGGSRHYRLVRRYGLTAQQVEELIEAQAGLCGICSRELGDKPHVDHDHETGAVRGILCFNCNGGLGQFGDDVERLGQAIEYLKGGRTPAAQAARAAEERLLELIDRLGRTA